MLAKTAYDTHMIVLSQVTVLALFTLFTSSSDQTRGRAQYLITVCHFITSDITKSTFLKR